MICSVFARLPVFRGAFRRRCKGPQWSARGRAPGVSLPHLPGLGIRVRGGECAGTNSRMGMDGRKQRCNLRKPLAQPLRRARGVWHLRCSRCGKHSWRASRRGELEGQQRQFLALWWVLGVDSNGNDGSLNDLWEFNPSTHEWAWMGGSALVGSNQGQPGVYGTLGVAAAGNVPGGRG